MYRNIEIFINWHALVSARGNMVYKSVKSGAKGQVAYKELEEMLDTYERIFQSRPFNLDRHVANPVS